MRIRQWFVALGTLLLGRFWRRQDEKATRERIVPAGAPERAAENWVLVLLALAALFAIGFVVAYALFPPDRLPNELLGVLIGGACAFIALALAIVAKRLVVTEELEEDYPQESPEEQETVAQIVHESGSRFTRKRMLLGASGVTAGALGLAAAAPAISLGPFWDTGPLDESPWHRGIRLVDENDAPFRAADIDEQTFYTAFPEGADKELLASPVVMVRLDPSTVHLPRGRAGWAPRGIVAYSKICTHAGCAVALYRKPTFPALEPGPALVCPCHYSTFNPADGAQVTYGPAGRPLPQLPLTIDSAGYLRAGGDFSQRVGPSWWNVRSRPT